MQVTSGRAPSLDEHCLILIAVIWAHPTSSIAYGLAFPFGLYLTYLQLKRPHLKDIPCRMPHLLFTQVARHDGWAAILLSRIPLLSVGAYEDLPGSDTMHFLLISSLNTLYRAIYNPAYIDSHRTSPL